MLPSLAPITHVIYRGSGTLTLVYRYNCSTFVLIQIKVGNKRLLRSDRAFSPRQHLFRKVM